MNKIYILLTLIATAIGINELYTSDIHTFTNTSEVVEASLVSAVSVKKKAKAELTSEEKEAFFRNYAAELHASISGSKPALPVFTQALQAYYSVNNEATMNKSNLLTVIDFSLPSTEKRLWVIDIDKNITLENTVVSHGKNSGMNEATEFSNEVNSHKSSLGAYTTAETYFGKHGLSLRLDGLEEGINDNARERYIVIHTAAYADPSVIDAQGRLGRSLGCPAIPAEDIDIIEKISNGSVLYIYADDADYSAKSKFKNYDNAYSAIESIMTV